MDHSVTVQVTSRLTALKFDRTATRTNATAVALNKVPCQLDGNMVERPHGVRVEMRTPNLHATTGEDGSHADLLAERKLKPP